MAKSAPKKSRRLGVWLFGAHGGLATTLVVGTHAIARGLADPHGLVTESPACAGIPMQELDQLVFGGHEIRDGDYVADAAEIDARTGSLPESLRRALAKDLAAANKNVVRGIRPNAGKTIDALVETPRGRRGAKRSTTLAQMVAQVQQDLRTFQRRNRLDGVVCVNLTSTEPPLADHPSHHTLAAFEQAIANDEQAAVRPSAIYAYAAATLGLPFVHFTPSNSALLPAIREAFAASKTPWMGCDGKTGETLVKSALAPMFRIRNLRVLSWQGYNILGDRDGRVLADRDNKQAKVATKDALLPSILGYPLHTHVGIDYVPSLHDLKTAWDFVHFEGFLGFKMSLQFTWQGCDAILAAPLVLDLVRFADLAQRRGESGPLLHLACYFKQPFGTSEHDLHRQWQLLQDYLGRTASPGASAAKRRAPRAPRSSQARRGR